jgi:hypothetical protein
MILMSSGTDWAQERNLISFQFLHTENVIHKIKLQDQKTVVQG